MKRIDLRFSVVAALSVVTVVGLATALVVGSGCSSAQVGVAAPAAVEPANLPQMVPPVEVRPELSEAAPEAEVPTVPMLQVELPDGWLASSVSDAQDVIELRNPAVQAMARCRIGEDGTFSWNVVYPRDAAVTCVDSGMDRDPTGPVPPQLEARIDIDGNLVVNWPLRDFAVRQMTRSMAGLDGGVCFGN